MNEPADRITSICIVAVRDVLLGEFAMAEPIRYAARIGDQRDKISSVLGNADAVFGNLERTLSRNGGLRFRRGAEAYARAVAQTVSRQRRRSHVHALPNIFGFRRTILRRLLLTTLGNKVRPPVPVRIKGRR